MALFDIDNYSFCDIQSFRFCQSLLICLVHPKNAGRRILNNVREKKTFFQFFFMIVDDCHDIVPIRNYHGPLIEI